MALGLSVRNAIMKRELVPCDKCLEIIPRDGKIFEEWDMIEGMFYYDEECAKSRNAQESDYYAGAA